MSGTQFLFLPSFRSSCPACLLLRPRLLHPEQQTQQNWGQKHGLEIATIPLVYIIFSLQTEPQENSRKMQEGKLFFSSDLPKYTFIGAIGSVLLPVYSYLRGGSTSSFWNAFLFRKVKFLPISSRNSRRPVHGHGDVITPQQLQLSGGTNQGELLSQVMPCA